MYSQNNEEAIIRFYFKEFKGRFLDIGANDGKTLSNTLWCAENGWSGVCVEPSETAFNKLIKQHKNHNVQCIQTAIGLFDGTCEFYESGNHLGTDDVSLISTINKNELDRWKNSNNVFTNKQTDIVTFETLLTKITGKLSFDLISIDAEGLDLDIMRQINFQKLKCKMLIVEYNRKEEFKFRTMAAQHKLKLFAKNHENLIFVI